jgi:integrase
MGTVFKPIVTRPLPPGAQLSEVDGKRMARWRTAQGAIRTAEVRTTPRGACVAIESSKYLARFKDGQGVTRTVPTRCKDQSAARAVLVELERRAELVRSGILTPAQDAVADHRRSSIGIHVQAYLASLQAKGCTPKHVSTVRHLLTALIEGCRFRTLADIRREPVERWLTSGSLAKRSARTRNAYVNAAKWLCNWCVDTERLVASPLGRLKRADEQADRRRQPRALTPDELVRLLDAARRRPLVEAGLVNRGWRKGQPGARLRPETRAKLEALGLERALIYKSLVLTGLRLGELASIRLCDVVLDGDHPHLVLEARNEKNREGSLIPLRADLCADLRRWVETKHAAAQARSGGAGAGHERLFAIRSNVVKVLNRDLRLAGIAKRDDRGRVVCVHSLRHTFATLLNGGGVAPRVAQAAMRHKSIDMTMRVYTDPRLLDVAGALNALPELPLEAAASSGARVLAG